MKRNQWLFLFLCIGALVSCNYIKDLQKKPVEPQAVARVGEEYLYKADIEKILPKNYTFEDSVRVASSFVNSWALKKLLMKRAEENISNQQKQEFETLVNEYRADLYTQSYKEMLVSNQLSKQITPQEQEEFYQTNKDIFKLNEILLKLRYIQARDEQDLSKKTIEKFKKFDNQSKKELDSLSLQFVSSYLNDSVWVRAADVYQKLPFLQEKIENKGSHYSQYFEKKDSTGVYLVKITDLLTRKDYPPLEYVEPTLNQIIINQRKNEYVQQLEKDIINTAIKRKQFEVYE